MAGAARAEIVGRRAEIAQFSGIADLCAKSGHGQALVIRGEAGIGKTRLVEEFKSILARNRSTLFFVNNRALSERLVRWINADEDEPLAYAHHGSLSREIRTVVEQRLRDGSLKAIVATSSLEMGIDIGHLDEVILVQSPKSIHSAIQRIGRAGHNVGDASRGRIYPTFGRDATLDHAYFLGISVSALLCGPVLSWYCLLGPVVRRRCGANIRWRDEVRASRRATNHRSTTLR